MHPTSAYMDSLHVVDLGVGMHVCGNVLHLLCYDVLPNTPAASMQFVWKEIDRLYHVKKHITISTLGIKKLL